MIQPQAMRPPDILIQALSPVDKAVSDKARIDQIMKKYNKDKKLQAPIEQWEGDNAS